MKSKKFILALLVALVALMVLPMPVAGASFAGMPMYVWGQNAPNVPTQVGIGENWIAASTASGGYFAINTSGELFAWGNDWDNNVMGQGGVQPPAAYLTGSTITVPRRVGTASNWVQTASMSNRAVAINSDGQMYGWGVAAANSGLAASSVPVRLDPANTSHWVYVTTGNQLTGGIHAINSDGELWAMGGNANGQLGLGDTTHRPLIFERVGTRSDWVSVSSGSTFTLGLTEDGAIWSWGNNVGGRTGLGLTSGNTLVPTQIGTAANWVEIVAKVSSQTGVALNEDGEIFSWGSPAAVGGASALGRIPNAANPYHRPGRVGTASNWTHIAGGNSHVLAFNSNNELWGWGNNSDGQVGDGTTANRGAPVFVVQTYGFETAARGGGEKSIMLLRTTPAEGDVYLTKRLQKPEGTELLGDITFTFTFERNSFQGNPDRANEIPNIPNRTITLNNASPSTTAGGITTREGTVDVLAGISFEQTGVFSWLVTEAATTGITLPSNMQDSQAVYEMRVYISQESGAFYIYAITFHRLNNDAGTVLSPPYKTDDFSFTNIYTRTTDGGTNGALVVSKAVTGPFADRTTVFNFDVTLTRTALCPPTTNFVGQVFNANNTPSGSPITFNSGTSTHVQLTDGQRLVFNEFLVGTTFEVTERAHAGFRPSVNLVVDGTVLPEIYATYVDEELSTGTHIAGSNENSAAFTNDFVYIPTGLVVSGSSLTIPLMVAAIALVAFVANAHRRRIEELPVI